MLAGRLLPRLELGESGRGGDLGGGGERMRPREAREGGDGAWECAGEGSRQFAFARETGGRGQERTPEGSADVLLLIFVHLAPASRHLALPPTNDDLVAQLVVPVDGLARLDAAVWRQHWLLWLCCRCRGGLGCVAVGGRGGGSGWRALWLGVRVGPVAVPFAGLAVLVHVGVAVCVTSMGCSWRGHRRRGRGRGEGKTVVEGCRGRGSLRRARCGRRDSLCVLLAAL